MFLTNSYCWKDFKNRGKIKEVVKKLAVGKKEENVFGRRKSLLLSSRFYRFKIRNYTGKMQRKL